MRLQTQPYFSHQMIHRDHTTTKLINVLFGQIRLARLLVQHQQRTANTTAITRQVHTMTRLLISSHQGYLIIIHTDELAQ